MFCRSCSCGHSRQGIEKTKTLRLSRYEGVAFSKRTRPVHQTVPKTQAVAASQLKHHNPCPLPYHSHALIALALSGKGCAKAQTLLKESSLAGVRGSDGLSSPACANTRYGNFPRLGEPNIDATYSVTLIIGTQKGAPDFGKPSYCRTLQPCSLSHLHLAPCQTKSGTTQCETLDVHRARCSGLLRKSMDDPSSTGRSNAFHSPQQTSGSTQRIRVSLHGVPVQAMSHNC